MMATNYFGNEVCDLCEALLMSAYKQQRNAATNQSVLSRIRSDLMWRIEGECSPSNVVLQ